MTKSFTGQCLCGAIRYEIRAPLADAHACHCGQCRRQSGHFIVATEVKRDDFVLLSDATLKWYDSSPGVKRGFCGECGSVMFWEDGKDDISVNAGSLDQPTGMKTISHIFVDDKADYYEIDDNLPKFAGYNTPMPDRQG